MKKVLGEYTCKVDNKGRIRLPSGLLDSLPPEDRDYFIVSRGFEQCLYLFPMKAWDKFIELFDNLNVLDQQSRMLQRIVYRGATQLKRDNVDRLNFPNKLLEWARIEPGAEVVLAGVRDRIEIWSVEEWERQFDVSAEQMNMLAQEVLQKTGANGSRPSGAIQ